VNRFGFAEAGSDSGLDLLQEFGANTVHESGVGMLPDAGFHKKMSG